MLKLLLDAVMARRARQLLDQVAAWLPDQGAVLDLGSGTGHLSALLEREMGLEVVTADVSDIHVVGRPPVLIADGVLPFEEKTFSAALLFFVLAYPNDPAAVLAEAARGSSSGRTWHSTSRSWSATSLRTRSSPCRPGASSPPRRFGGKC